MQTLSRQEAAALAALDIDGLVTLVRELIAHRSVTGTREESAAQHWLADVFRADGLDTDLWPIDLSTTTADPDFPGMEAPREDAWGLVGRWGGGTGPTLVLNGHIDVVPPGDVSQWCGSPWEPRLDGGAVHGRGACDMKGGLACALFAVRAIRDAGVPLDGSVLLQSVVGEEDGGLGTFATLRRGHRGDVAVIPEPTSLTVVPACAGALTFRLRVAGRSAHASVRREGVSAIDAFWPVAAALRALEAQRNADAHPLMAGSDLPYPLSIGVLRAGDWPSSVPDRLVAEGRLGVRLGEEPAAAREQLERAVAEACDADPWLRDHPVHVEWFGGQFASGWIPVEHRLVELVQGVHRDLHGGPPDLRGAPYGSDLRLLVGLGGTPTVHYGPGSVRHAHAPTEHVPVVELVAVARALVLTALRVCGAQAARAG